MPAIFAGGKKFVGFNEVNQMMCDSLLFGERNLRRADIEVTVNLGGIADENFAV